MKWYQRWQEYGIPDIAWLAHDLIVAAAFVMSLVAFVAVASGA